MSAGAELLAFTSKISVDPDVVKNAENIRDLHLIIDCPAQVFGLLDTADYEKLLAEFGGALSLQIGLPNLPPLLSIDAGQTPMSLADGVKALRGMNDDLELRLNLSVAKGPLLAQWGLNGGDLYLLPYLYSEGFLRLLGGDLRTLDKYLFSTPGRGTLVILDDSDIALSGSLLHIAGLRTAKRIVATAQPLSARLLARLDHYREVARTTLSWSGFELLNITPVHFLVDDQQQFASRKLGTGNGELPAPNAALRIPHATFRRLLATHALSTNVLFTANRSMSGDEVFESRYASADNLAKLNLPDTAEITADSRALVRWALWPFAGDSGDRLTILQNVATRELTSDDAAENYAALTARLGHILNEARWHHRIFVDRQIDSHFQELQELSELVSGVTTQVGAAIDSLTKGFVEALLGAVGVIVLTLLAALVETNRPGLVFQAGMWAYAVYLVLFQGVYRMGSLLHSYKLLEEETQARMAVYERRLGPSRVTAALAMLEGRKRQFWIWFAVTAVLYGLIALFLIFLAGWLPGWLAQVTT